MPTQLSRLLRPPALGQADPLVDRLKRKEPEAEREIARRYNRKITDHSRTIPEPKSGGNYDTYDPRHLALLWTLADNADALHALGRQLRLSVATPPDYTALSDDLLARLWELGRDGLALEQLWLRRKLLPVTTLGPDTPENVLGFLCWQQFPGAWDELLRRYALLDIQLCADEDQAYPAAEAQLLERFRLSRVPRVCQGAREFAAVAAGKLLHLVPLWDYVAYPSIEHMLVKAAHNELRDMARAGRRRSALSTDELPEAADPVRCVPGSDAELQDFLAARLPLEERVIRKAQNGLDLTDEERDWAARRNLEAGTDEPSDEAVAVERARIARWLADNPSPTGDHLNKIFPWYKPTQFGKASRIARLRLLAEEADRYLDQLAAEAPAVVRPLRRQVRRGMDELLQRTASGNRPVKRGRPRPGPVACFEGLVETSRLLLHLLGDRPLDHRRAEAFARLHDTLSLFGEQFPVLVKLAACRRLARVVPAAAELAAWLDAGQKWLSSLHEDDREKCRTFAETLGALPLTAGPRAGALPLLLAWLQATQQPGPAEARLEHADRAWWLSQGREDQAEPADTLAEFALAGKWSAAAETAAQMLRRLGPVAEVSWSADCEFRTCLERLRVRCRDLPARLEAARRLLAHLRDNHPAPRLADWSARVEALDSDAEDDALYREVNAAAPAGPPALALLALWLQPAGESRFAERALKDLTTLWALTHDPWYTWPAGVAAEVAGLIAAARDGDWPRLADAAARTLRRNPDLSGVGRAAGEEFRAALQRLAHRRGQRTRARRTST